MAENEVVKARTTAIAPENWADLLSIDVKHQVERAADDINDVEWLRHKNIAEKLREIRTTIGKEHEGNWLAFTRSGVLNISSRPAQAPEAAHDSLQAVPSEQELLQKRATRATALAARRWPERRGHAEKTLAELRTRGRGGPKIRELGGLLSRAGSGAKARTQKQWEALKQQMEEDADRLADHREWLQAQLKEMVDRLNAIRTDRGMDPVEHPEYDAGEYQGVIDKAMRRDGAVQVAKKEYRTVSVTKNARAKVLS